MPDHSGISLRRSCCPPRPLGPEPARLYIVAGGNAKSSPRMRDYIWRGSFAQREPGINSPTASPSLLPSLPCLFLSLSHPYV